MTVMVMLFLTNLELGFTNGLSVENFRYLFNESRFKVKTGLQRNPCRGKCQPVGILFVSVKLGLEW